LKALLRTLVIFVVALPFLAIAAVLMCFQDKPLVTTAVQLTPQFGAAVFAGTVLMCLGAAVFAFRRVSRIDPALVFRG